MSLLATLRRRLKLRHALFIAFLLSGIIPLIISSALLIRQNREVLTDQERDQVVLSAAVLSQEVTAATQSTEDRLEQIGMGLVARVRGSLESTLRERWVSEYLSAFMREHQQLLAMRILDPAGKGPLLAPSELPPPLLQALDQAYGDAAAEGLSSHRFVVLEPGDEPGMVLAVPVRRDPDGPFLVVEAVSRLKVMKEVFQREAQGDVAVFLLDGRGKILWSEGASDSLRKALADSEVTREFARHPMTQMTEYRAPDPDHPSRQVEVLARVSLIEGVGWGVVVQRPVAMAFAAVDRMVFNTVLSSLLLVSLALLFAALAARRVGQPIQRLTATSHEIAEGKFDRRVDLSGLSFELADLAADFNRMGSHIERYVEQLRDAARQNRDLFIGLLRAMAAAIDAKDPYTRGHSERVATVSRIIARNLQLAPEMQEKVWIAAVLHDVGKIGIDDRVLQKVGMLEPEEFEQMKLHTVIGAEIITPVEQLREMVPAIRWHHENWNGKGYPDGLKGEEIPLMARVIAVADTFDAITTNRPYQQAYTLEYAVETIERLTGSRFDAKIVTAFLRAYEAGEIKPAPQRPIPAERRAVGRGKVDALSIS